MCPRGEDRGTIVVTEHRRRVARLIPETESLDERLVRLRTAGSIQWSGRRLGATTPAGRVRGKRTVAALVVENRACDLELVTRQSGGWGGRSTNL